MDNLPCLIDTDMSIDDWAALLFSLRTPRLDVQAVTIAATGIAHGRPGAHTALRLLQLSGHLPVPVAIGQRHPLQGRARAPLWIRLLMDARLFLPLPKTQQWPVTQTAVQQIIATAQAVDGKLLLLALAPLTNIAAALQQQPALADKLQVVAMGGAIAHPGNIRELRFFSRNRTAEWNFYLDPLAAELVMQQTSLTLFPLDVTFKVPLSTAVLAHLQANQNNPAAAFLVRLCQRNKTAVRRNRFFLWDLVVAVACAHPEIASYTEQRLQVTTQPGVEYGRLQPAAAGHLVRVCTGIDQAQFEAYLLDGFID